MNLLNRLGGLAHSLGIKPFALNADKILEQARSASGFDFVDPSMREGLDALIDDVSANGNPNAFGQIAIQKLLQRNATARFQIEKAIKRYVVQQARIPQVRQLSRLGCRKFTGSCGGFYYGDLGTGFCAEYKVNGYSSEEDVKLL